MPHYSRASAHTISRIRALLDEGLDPSAIVERLSVATSTVYVVQAGRAKPRVRKQRERETDQHGLVVPDPMSEPGKCPMCHSMVRLPCYACAVRKWMKEQKANQ